MPEQKDCPHNDIESNMCPAYCKSCGKVLEQDNWREGFKKKYCKLIDVTGFNDEHTRYEYKLSNRDMYIIDFISSLLSSQAHALKEKMKALCGEEIPTEIPYDEEEKALAIKIIGTSDTPEYLRERRYGMEIQRKRMLSAIESIEI